MSSNKKSSGGKGKETLPPKCTCEDPYKCTCGNRPERPSKGHKWDPETQQWGGKGHKQKGASSQAATIGAAAKVTAIGKTVIAEWQKLPTSLLEDYCKKERRPCPSYTCNKKGKLFQYQVIIQDAKVNKRGVEHDLRFIPVLAVENEEQAQQEAALLVLLHLTPKLPHELKLPEPYKTTWLHAIQSASNNNNNNKPSPSTGIIDATATTVSSSSSTTTSLDSAMSSHAHTSSPRAGAQISTHLSLANTYISETDKRKKLEAQRQLRNEMIQKHEAIRLANRDHPVFMSARIRKQIELILRDSSSSTSIDHLALLQSLQDGNEEFMGDDHNNELLTVDVENTSDTDVNYIKTYIVQRLIHEGFTKAQAITAFNATKESRSKDEQREDGAWDTSYETCLQWLCIHLEEDQLPLGFDPRGSTLDVVLPSSQGKVLQRSNSNSQVSLSSSSTTTAGNTTNMNSIPIESIMNTYGTSRETSQYLATVAHPDITFWDALCHVASTNQICSEKMNQLWDSLSQTEKESNIQSTEEELETLTAIFADDIKVSSRKSEGVDVMTVSICLPRNNDGETKDLVIQYRKGLYPSTSPITMIKGGWKGAVDCPIATLAHLELVKFLGQQVLGEPLIYSLYNFVLDTMNQRNKVTYDGYASDDPLVQFFHSKNGSIINDEVRYKSSSNDVNIKKNIPVDQEMDPQYALKKRTRPRSKNDFWNTPGEKIPPAIAFPKISTLLTTTRAALPAAKTRDEFLSKLKESRVVVLSGETGCGKSTQIPQFILEDSPRTAKIIVTQPRRLAAIGVGNRVAQERGEEKPGEGSVGYVVRGESAISYKCRLLFCTTGVLLRQLQNENALSCITHIVVDEVHERSLDCDVLLAILKELLPSAPHLRVILMSATMDADRFASYWGRDTPRLFIPGFTYPVSDFTLEDVLSMTGYVPPKNSKNKNRMFSGLGWGGGKPASRDALEFDNEPEESIVTIQSSPDIPMDELIKRVKEDEIDYNIIGTLVTHLIKNKAGDSDGSILVFLPGAPEINQAERAVLFYAKGLPFQVIQLHGGIQPSEQQRVFVKAPSGVTKVILSTNIAETSITIPDCTMVIDTCREKQSSFDPSNRMPILAEQFCAKDSLRQRRGRAGRVRQGTCYKIITRKTLSELPDHSEPEIKRCALDQTILSLLFLGLDDGNGSFMSKMFDPPEEKAITSATCSLQKLGAVELSSKGPYNVWKLTPLGMHLAGIPAPPCIGKLLVMGSLLGCRSFSLAMASGMSVGRSPIIKIDIDKYAEQSSGNIVKEKILKERAAEYSQIGHSDLAFLAHLFLLWNESKEKKVFCDKLGLSLPGMKEMKQLYHQLDDSLSAVGFYENKESDKNTKSWRLIRCCLVSALSPNQLVRVERGAAKYAETAEGSLEIEGPAKDLRFYIRGDQNSIMKKYHDIAEERVFIHPSSMNFTVSSYSCPWIVYHELVRTSKAFLRDTTECSAYALLLFGGDIKVEASNNLIMVDGYVRLSANARIGALIGGLRRKIDHILSEKVANPAFDVSSSIEMKLIVQLIVSDGL